MKVGMVLPTFVADAGAALEVAARASAAGLDGVFAYDHLYPMGSPERPALAPFPVLAAVAARQQGLHVGPLVARVGLVGGEVLVAQLAALDELSGGRAICALGTGDRLSAEENERWGIPTGSAAERREALEAVARMLLAAGREVWVGGGARPTLDLAERLGATVNLWAATPEQVAEQARSTPVSWAGPMPGDGQLPGLLDALAEAGASWAVLGGSTDVELIARSNGGRSSDN